VAALLTEPAVEKPREPELVTATQWESFEATAYTADCPGCIGITKTGIDVRHTIVDGEGRRIIAVDPGVIPLGSMLEIRIGNELSNEVITGIAADIGGAIRGNRIDVLYATYDEAMTFGRQGVAVRIVEK
jgi:3D (Asp-Asp-Asp) domain-containing protein